MNIEVGLKSEPVVVIDEKLNQKMEMLIDMVSSEVGWYGLVEREDVNVFRVKDIYILEQEVNGGTTEISAQSLAKLSDRLDDEHIITEENYNKLGLFMWGHSHANMDPTPSQQDDNQFSHICGVENPPFFIRLIQNKKRDRKVTLYLKDTKSEINDYFLFDDVPWVIESEGRDKIKAELEAEVKAKVKVKTTTISAVKSTKVGVPSYYGNIVSESTYDYDDMDSYYADLYGYKNAVKEYKDTCNNVKVDAKVETKADTPATPPPANNIVGKASSPSPYLPKGISINKPRKRF